MYVYKYNNYKKYKFERELYEVTVKIDYDLLYLVTKYKSHFNFILKLLKDINRIFSSLNLPYSQ